MFAILSENGMRALCKLRSEHFIDNSTFPATARQVKLTLPALLYIFGLSETDSGTAMYEGCLCKNWKFENLAKSGRAKNLSQLWRGLITAMVQYEENISIKGEYEKYCLVWFGIAFVFLSYAAGSFLQGHASQEINKNATILKCLDEAWRSLCVLKEQMKLWAEVYKSLDG